MSKTLFKLEIKEAENDSRGRQVFINGQEVKYVEKYTVSHTETFDDTRTKIEIVATQVRPDGPLRDWSYSRSWGT